jgi:16S rRNA (uracil1498-N3)-methyltransferase
MQRSFHGGDIAVGTLELTERESHHLCRVARARVGVNIMVLNGNGVVAYGNLRDSNGKCAKIAIEKVVTHDAPPHSITLLQATLKGSNNEWLIREGTAIGVAEIVFVETQNAECRVSEKIDGKIARWKSVAAEGCKQSGNPFLPKISWVEKLKMVNLSAFDLKIFAGLSVGAKPLASATELPWTAKNTCVAVGPEGDFSASEYDFLKENGFVECKLAGNTLRSGTAAIYALSVLDQLINSG